MSKYYTEIKSCFLTSELYADMINRLNDDVKSTIQSYESTGKGNWAAIRMLAPIIEAASGGKYPARNSLLSEIGIEYPNLFWLMYRHGLLHNDFMPQSVILGSESIGWGFNWGQKEAATMIAGNNYSINPAVIYRNLEAWLRREHEDRELNVVTAVRINEDINSVFKSEFINARKS